MIRRLVGALFFVGLAALLFDLAGRPAWEQRAGWGWFLGCGLMLVGAALNLWIGEVPTARCPRCQKLFPPDDLE
jgi:drug/metabolite transporter (DMT)-like permease